MKDWPEVVSRLDFRRLIHAPRWSLSAGWGKLVHIPAHRAGVTHPAPGRRGRGTGIRPVGAIHAEPRRTRRSGDGPVIGCDARAPVRFFSAFSAYAFTRRR